MLKGLGVVAALGMGLLACGGRSKDETRLAEPDTREGPPETRVGAQQPSAGATNPPASASSGEQASASESADGGLTPQRCEPGTGRCNGARAEKCSPDGVWLFVEECARCNGFNYCFADPQLGAHCLAPTCCFPEMRCSGAYLQQCNQAATGFETIELCASAALCEVGLTGGSCLPGCSPGETRCTGERLERCNDDLTGYELVEQCSASCDTRCRVDAGADATGE